MNTSKAALIAQLQKELLPLQGFKTISNNALKGIELGPINNAFPNARFPLGAVHEFFYSTPEDASATTGFVSGILSSLMQNGGAVAWISSSCTIFPPALKSFGIAPDKIIFIELQKEKEILWTVEESLKCNGLAAVIGEMSELSFTASRRLQLAVEQSSVTGFIFRKNPRNENTTACVTRWKITSIPGELMDGIPGVGFPRWKVNLEKVRNGYPGNWQLEWATGGFRFITQPATNLDIIEHHLKAG